MSQSLSQLIESLKAQRDALVEQMGRAMSRGSGGDSVQFRSTEQLERLNKEIERLERQLADETAGSGARRTVARTIDTC